MDDLVADLGIKPVSADAPTGISIRYEPEFEQLQEEIAKLESVNADPVNWADVVETGTSVLREKSKDLLVACYVCHGLYERKGYQGLAEGLSILDGLVTNYWETLFPELKRHRARIAAMEWMAERLGILVPDRKPRPADREAVATCKALLEKLDEVLKDKHGDQAPALGELYRPLREYDADFAREEARREQKAKA